ncbi:MAG: proline--tRNA ligase [Candidatus Methanomethylicia archaeon]|nr:proline--tRNA ligase [Candidatus Methanomethylicia archaeon]MCX8168865.1 proline--tRNA ligase [Candidatus Methanomethylicia archaeon]MDW7988597.1 proline--tRNA ligase [Nitrososphaerota archaeon]
MGKVKRELWLNNFGEWFRNILDEAEIYDYRYPVKGCGVWMPYGFAIRKNVINVMREILNSLGHEEILLPLLIPEDLFEKESEHIRGFEKQVFWVTKGGDTELDVKLALRPTSETVIGPMLKLWIKAHTDLPRKYYQIVSTFRYETKATRPMIRVREITTFKEAHTTHATFEDSEKQIREAIYAYSKIFDELCIPYVKNRRPDWDKFAGALYTIAFDTIMPDGKVMQIGTIHNLGQNFAKAFDIKYLTPEGKMEYVWQTCYGISERAIAALIAIHGDDNGIVLPPHIAPIQVIIVPIPYKSFEEEVDKTCKEVLKVLIDEGIRAKYDDREITPGSKFYYWEKRGVPIRIEIGPEDLKDNCVTISRRDTLTREKIDRDKLVNRIKELMVEIRKSIRDRAWEMFKSNIRKVRDMDEFKKFIEFEYGIIEVDWCGKEECAHKLEEEIDVLGEPCEEHYQEPKKCIVCSGEARKILRLSKTY